jgi:uncharacterized protein (DUF58 family)
MGRARTQIRLTQDGAAYVVFTLAALGVSALSGNNLLYLLSALLVALGVVSELAGRWNLRGLAVRRALAADLFARRPAIGQFVVQRHGRWGASFDLRVEEAGGQARAGCAELVVGAAVSLSTGWRFERRGRHTLGEVRISSLYPFRLVERSVLVELPETVWVYPEIGEPLEEHGAQEAAGERSSRHPDQLEDLRAYREGDLLRDVHWPSSARVGSPIVAVRRGEVNRPLWVRVPDEQGEALELALRRATGSVLDGFLQGRAVGLELAEGRWPPRSGAPWRRELLVALASVGARS